MAVFYARLNASLALAVVTVARELAPAGLRSRPKPAGSILQADRVHRFLRDFLARQLEVIQRPIHCQFAEHDQLRNPQQRPALRRRYDIGEVIGDGSG